MSQSGEELLNRINATLDVLQDAQEEAVEAVRDVATHKADPQAHGEAIAAAVEAAVSEALGGASGGGGVGEELAGRLTELEGRFDGSGTVLAANLPLTDAVNSATGQLAASDTAVKTAYDKAAATAGLWIGVPRPWRSTTLPPNYCWANGDFVAFADWPELKAVYESGGFAGMLMAWEADKDAKAANLGQWRPDAMRPTGLFTPNLTGQFLRCWGPDAGEGAGAWGADTGRGLTGGFSVGSSYGSLGIHNTSGAFRTMYSSADVLIGGTSPTVTTSGAAFDAERVWGAEHTSAEFALQHIWQPIIIYLGQPAKEAA